MRFLRAHQRVAARLAIVALLVQFAVSFAHVHPEDLVPGSPEGVPSAAQLSPARPDSPGSPTSSAQHDFCTICASIALASVLVLPRPPPTVVVATVQRRAFWIDRVINLVSCGQPRYFQARGPPA